jgi:hypothetical protein
MPSYTGSTQWREAGNSLAAVGDSFAADLALATLPSDTVRRRRC